MKSGSNCTVALECMFTTYPEFFDKFHCREYKKYYQENWGPVPKKKGERYYTFERDIGWECIGSFKDSEVPSIQLFLMKKGDHVIILGDAGYRKFGTCPGSFIRHIWEK
jgi:urate oxidase